MDITYSAVNGPPACAQLVSALRELPIAQKSYARELRSTRLIDLDLLTDHNVADADIPVEHGRLDPSISMGYGK